MLIKVDKVNGEFKLTEYISKDIEGLEYELSEVNAENTSLKQELYELQLELRKVKEDLEICNLKGEN